MNTFSNNSTMNGWPMPGSGTWATPGLDSFFVDENGDLWLPCLCGEASVEEPEEAAGAGSPLEAPPPARAVSSGCRCVIQYNPDYSGCFVCVNYPEAILYYPGQTLPAGYRMGMLADWDKGCRWYYKGAHTGKVRLHIAQTNATRRRGPLDCAFPGVPLRYAVLLENHLETPAAVTIRKQGAGIGEPPNAAQASYFASREAPPMELPPASRTWLFLGERGFSRSEGEQARIDPGCRFEAQLDLECSAEVTIICCAYEEKAQIGGPGEAFSQCFWPLPPQAGSFTGVGGAWQLDGHFTWTLGDESCGQPLSLEACPAYDEGKGYSGWVTNLSHAGERARPGQIDRDIYFPVRGDILPLRVPMSPSAGLEPERILFEPPPGPVAAETRCTENCPGLCNRGVVYHQIFVIHNRGARARSVQYYVAGAGGPDVQACVYHANEGRIIDYRSSSAPEALVANVKVPAGETRFIETCFILSGGEGLGHRLIAKDELSSVPDLDVHFPQL